MGAKLTVGLLEFQHSAGSLARTFLGVPFRYRQAVLENVEAMARCRLTDPAAGPADERMADYFAGTYHPGDALRPRAGFAAFDGDVMVGYIAGHRTTRMGAEGEIEYLFVAPAVRRQGVARELTRLQLQWFLENGARDVIVNTDPDYPGSTEFYLSCGAKQLNRHWLRWPDLSLSNDA